MTLAGSRSKRPHLSPLPERIPRTQPEWDQVVNALQGLHQPQQLIGGYLWPQTPAEIAAGVTPTNYAYAPGNVFRYGAKGDGATDDTTAIRNALLVAAQSVNGSQVGIGGGTAFVYLPTGNYKTSGTLNRPTGIYIVGDGPEATSITATGNYAVIATTGSSTNILNRGGVQNLCINGTWGGNHANTASIGISESWTNRSIHRDVRLHGCYQGMYGIALWQVTWDNIHADGGGAQQNNIGFFLDQLPTTFPAGTSNAVAATGCLAQGVADTGFRLLNPNGSKFLSCEAENGNYGWLIGNTSTGCYPIEFAHFANCLADTNGVYGWVIQQGSNAVPCTYMQLANCWGSSAGTNGFFLDGCSQINLSNLQAGNNGAAGIYLHNCQYTLVGNCELQGNNTSLAASIGDITIDGGQYNRVYQCTSQNFNASGGSVSVLEKGATNANSILDNSLFSSATIIGANSVALRNQGYRTENNGTATITSGNTSIVVGHTLAVTPNISAISLTPQSSLGAAAQFWTSNPTATTFQINVNANPGANVSFSWAINANTHY